MKLDVSILVACGAGLAACAHPTETREQSSAERAEANLAQLLEGRVAGEPRSCITILNDQNLRVIDRTALVYDAGAIIWVSRPANPRALDQRNILVTERFGRELCRHDVIRTLDRQNGTVAGVVFLGDFVPYRKPAP
jgi:hypothetical protein